MERDFDRIVAQLVDSGQEINARWNGPEVERLGGSGSVVLHTHNVQQYSANWLAAIQNPKLLDVAEQLIGPDIVLHHTKLFQKPAEKGAPFPMHQDCPYFPSTQDTMIAAIIHVSEADDEMGCLRVYPGSHKLGRLGASSGHSDEFMARFPIEGATVCPAKPGDVLFFHYFTVHGSMPNRSDRVRKTVLVQMHAGDDLPEDLHAHPYEALCLRGWNSRATREAANRTK